MKKKLIKYGKLTIDIIFIILLSLLLITFVGQTVRVDGKSMESTLHHNDLLYLNKLAYLRDGPKRFDVLVFSYDDKVNINHFIKRVIGLPGETIRIDSTGAIFVNEEKLEENYGKEAIGEAGIAKNGIVLKEDEYFLMGDNRNNSFDSRFLQVGPVKKSKILGKIAFY